MTNMTIVESRTFHFVWEKGSLNSNGTKILKDAGIRFCYIMQKLHASDGSRWCPVEYRKENEYVWSMTF